MKYSKELHDRLRERTQITNIEAAALLDEIERLQAERRWIPVSERPPEKGQRCWIYYRLGALEIIKYVRIMGDSRDNNRYTHWMPLPPAPESEVENAS